MSTIGAPMEGRRCLMGRDSDVMVRRGFQVAGLEKNVRHLQVYSLQRRGSKFKREEKETTGGKRAKADQARLRSRGQVDKISSGLNWAWWGSWLLWRVWVSLSSSEAIGGLGNGAGR